MDYTVWERILTSLDNELGQKLSHFCLAATFDFGKNLQAMTLI